MTTQPGLFGFSWMRPMVMRRLRMQVVAVNVGGFVIPVLLSLLALSRLLTLGVNPMAVVVTFGSVVACLPDCRTECGQQLIQVIDSVPR